MEIGQGLTKRLQNEQEMQESKFKIDLDRQPESVKSEYYKRKMNIIGNLVDQKISRNISLDNQKKILESVLQGDDFEGIKSQIIESEKPGLLPNVNKYAVGRKWDMTTASQNGRPPIGGAQDD